MAWDDLATTYTVRNARIVVAIHDGGAVVEAGDVDYIEGRFATAMNDGDDPTQPPFLQREMTFHRHGRLDPLSVAMTKARIVIDGMTEDGPLEIRGDGYFGYDEHGQIEGSFSEPPMMLLDKLEFPDMQAAAIEEKGWVATEPAEPAEFQRACRRRGELRDEDE